MKRSFDRLNLAALSLIALSLLAVPHGALAQDAAATPGDASGDATVSKQKISLDLESTNLYTGLKLLFSHIHANFALDPSLKQAEVTVHLKDVPFDVALETLLKASGLPLTYRYENSVYSIVPKEDSTTGPTSGDEISSDTNEKPDAETARIIKIHSDELTYNAVDIVRALGGRVISVGDSGTFGQGGMMGGMGGMTGFGGMGGMGAGGYGGLGGGLGGFGGGIGSNIGGFGGGFGGGIGGNIGGLGGGYGGGLGGGLGGRF